MSKNLPLAVRQIENHLEISTRHHKADMKVSNHWHDYFEFEAVLYGEYEHNFNTKMHIAKRGSAWITSYLDCHSLKCLSDATLINISFTEQEIDSELVDFLSVRTGGFLCEFDEEEIAQIKRLCDVADENLSKKDAFWHCYVKSALEQIIISAVRKGSKGESSVCKTPPKLLQSVMSYLHQNYKNDVSLSTVAEKFGVSSGHLGLIFSENFGTSYNSYVNKLRLRYACNMLQNSSLCTKEIAKECGFNSTEYFYYIFKKHMSQTPKEYRNSKNCEQLS